MSRVVRAVGIARASNVFLKIREGEVPMNDRSTVIVTGASSGSARPLHPGFVPMVACIRVDIDVPEFFEITRELSLVYNSTQRLRYTGYVQALASVGFRLEGIPAIERVNPHNGTPRFDGSDVYRLDGERMIRCSDVTVSSPSCDNGGNWAGRIETFQKIKYNPSQNSWFVTRKDGVQYTFRPVSDYVAYDASDLAQTRRATQYRWLLSEVHNPNGRTVTYDHCCDTNSPNIGYCTPEIINYGPYSIKLRYKTRPDRFTYATGAGLLDVKRRLHTVEVRSNGQLRFAYQLTYSNGTLDEVSQLTGVRKFGSNATISTAWSREGRRGRHGHSTTPHSAPSGATTRPSTSATGRTSRVM